jgi:hypothetical protein
MDEVPSGYRPAESISGCIHDTPGHFDSTANIDDGAAGNVNVGARKRYLMCNQAVALECYDSVDLTGDKKRYVVSSFELKLKLTRIEQTKC